MQRLHSNKNAEKDLPLSLQTSMNRLSEENSHGTEEALLSGKEFPRGSGMANSSVYHALIKYNR